MILCVGVRMPCSKGISAVLSLGDSLGGAYLCAAAAGDALVGVDVIDVAGCDSTYRAYGLACSASYTVVANYVSHSCCCFKVRVILDLSFLNCDANLVLYSDMAKKYHSNLFCGSGF